MEHQLSETHVRWLEDVRRVDSEIGARLGVVSKGANIAFEYRRNGVLSFLKVRKEVLEGGERTKDFWIEPKGSELFLWNADCLSGPSDTLIVTEGEFDALSCIVAGHTHVVSVPNGAPNKLGEDDIKPNEDRQFAYLWSGGKLKPELQAIERFILAVDADRPGQNLRDELAIRLGRTRCCYVAYPAGCKDANEVLVRHGVDALRQVLADAKPIVPDTLVSFCDIPARADAQRFSSGWGRFDQHMMIAPPQLVVITGVPNSGKSQWMLALGANLARVHGLNGAILQFEDGVDRNRADLLRYARAWRESLGETPEAWVDRMFRTISPAEEIDDDRDRNLAWLDEKIEEAATRHGCRWVAIDPWNEIEHLWGRQDTEATYLNRALKHLKRLARRFQITVFIVAHPTKEGGKSMTIDAADLYDVNGGAVWNNKADIGVIVWADDVKKPDRKIKVCKSKDFARMGMPGIVTMRYDPRHATYSIVG